MTSLHSGFAFKEHDEEGLETLRVISDATNFNNWTFEAIRPWCTGTILEIGSGIGNISDRFISRKADITLTDIRNNYLAHLKEKYPHLADENKIRHLDLVHPDFDNTYSDLFSQFDSVFALNVVEHIEDDHKAVSNAFKFLKPGGRLILLMPAYQSLYNNFDRELYHFRRYNRSEMIQLLLHSGCSNISSFYFNAAGIPGWIFSGNFLRYKTIPQSQMNLFDKLVPVFRLVDRLLMKKTGLSVIGIGEKK